MGRIMPRHMRITPSQMTFSIGNVFMLTANSIGGICIPIMEWTSERYTCWVW